MVASRWEDITLVAVLVVPVPVLVIILLDHEPGYGFAFHLLPLSLLYCPQKTPYFIRIGIGNE